MGGLKNEKDERGWRAFTLPYLYLHADAIYHQDVYEFRQMIRRVATKLN